MLFKTTFLLVVIFVTASTCIYAQPDFCSGLKGMVADATEKFKVTKGRVTSASENGLIWEANLKIPGTIKSRLISSMGICYEGALYQTKNSDDLMQAYDQYKAKLKECLHDYKMTAAENFSKDLDSYKKLIFLKPSNAELPPPHVSLEVDYYKTAGLYTIVLYVWEH